MFRFGQRFGTYILRQHIGRTPQYQFPITASRLCERLLTLNERGYATGNAGDDGNKSRGGQTPCEAEMRSKRIGKDGDCKPQGRRTPCSPISPDCQKIPSIDDCQKEKILYDCSKPDCPYDEPGGINPKLYKRIIWLGVILATVAAGVMILLSRKPADKKKRKKVVATKSKRLGIVEKNPSKSTSIPNNIPYLVIGGGTAAFAAFRSIKSTDPTAKILIISAEPYKPYMRPPLSKEMWLTEDKEMQQNMEFTQWNGKVRSMFYEPDDFYTDVSALLTNPNGGVSVASGWRVDKIDVIEKRAYLEDGSSIKYEKCLIATGAKPKQLEILENIDEAVADRINVLRNISDFNCIRDNLMHAKSVAVIGGGFLGTELSCAIARFGKRNKLEVIQVYKEGGVLAKILPEYLSLWTTGRVQEEGVEIIPGAYVMEAIADGDQVQLTLSNNIKLTVDEVMLCIGMQPNTQMAESSLLEVDPQLGGFVVNAELQARTGLWVAGDAASFYDTEFGRRRLEHHDNAVVTGRIAGENMTGSAKTYNHQSMFWSDIGKHIGFEAIGNVNSKLPTVGVFVKSATTANSEGGGGDDDELAQMHDGGRVDVKKIPQDCEKYASKEYIEEQRQLLAKQREQRSMEKDNEDFGKGIVFYLKDDIVVGMVLWNVFHRIGIARQVLADKRKYDDLNEVAKLFKIHEE